MRVLIFGATGSAGGSVLQACLGAANVDEVRVITRRPLAVTHVKLRVFEHKDFLDFGAVTDAFAGVDACFFCLGVSVTQVPDEQTYRLITHDFTVSAARALKAGSPAATFHYISGQGTKADSRMMWARVKAETEEELRALCGAVCWRPAFIDGELSESGPQLYQAIRPLLRLLRPFTGLYVTGADLGLAMIQAARDRLTSSVVENAEIRALASRARKG
jgi:uncharacterized protein YbjT (DUF2867 family)